VTGVEARTAGPGVGLAAERTVGSGVGLAAERTAGPGVGLAAERTVGSGVGFAAERTAGPGVGLAAERTAGLCAGLEAAAAAVVEGRRAALTAAFGWTRLAVAALADPYARTLRLRGTVAVPRLRAGLVRELAPLLPPGWRVDATAVTPLAGLGWRAPGPGATRLWRTPWLAEGTCLEGQMHGLTSELLAGDGPVELLHARGEALLVRARDGTVGWVRGPLAPASGPEAGRLAAVRPGEAGLRRLAAGLRSYLGVPYRLGGATRWHIDCSGLVQRCVRDAFGVVLPRHSRDQLALAPAAGGPGEPGDLVFLGGDGAWHVGVVLAGPRRGGRTLIHASTSRGRVIEEPLARGLARAGEVRHVPLARVLGRT
jgi:hypothetical protein